MGTATSSVGKEENERTYRVLLVMVRETLSK